MLGLHHGQCQLGSRYALARHHHTDYGWVESELSFHIWRQKAANAKGEKLQMMKGLFSEAGQARLFPHGLSHSSWLPGSPPWASLLWGSLQFLLHKDSKENAHAGGCQQRAAAHA